MYSRNCYQFKSEIIKPFNNCITIIKVINYKSKGVLDGF